jgi:hypothetical protein
MEFHELLENEKFQAAIGAEKLALYLNEDGSSLMWEDFENEASPAFVLEGEHKMGIWIQKWHGFYIWSDAETSTDGAADSLENLIGEYLFELESWGASDPVIRRFEGSDISLQNLKSFASNLIANNDEIKIDGKDYQKIGGELVEVS